MLQGIHVRLQHALRLKQTHSLSLCSWIWADEVRLSQILTNLLSNAAKFTEEGGEIEVSVSARRSLRRASLDGAGGPSSTGKNAYPESSAHLPECEVVIAVRDTGIGIPAAFQEVLFDAFTQCDNSRTKKYEGGLALTVRLYCCQVKSDFAVISTLWAFLWFSFSWLYVRCVIL